MPPEKLGRYEILEEIGVGGMGTVYRAKDTTIDMEVAIKILHEHLRADEKSRHRFFNDARALGKLKHPNIVQIYATEMENHYFVMELIKGDSLKKIITDAGGGGLKPRRAAAIALKVADALRYIHDMNIIHRDIKPQNIIVGHQDSVKLLDFGIAREKKSETTSTGSLLGTVEYMSPEQLAGESDIDQRTDIYSFGIILYESLTGRVPFSPPSPESTLWQVVERITNETPARAIELNPKIPPYLDELVMRCIEKDKNARRNSSGEVYVELENTLKLMEGTMSGVYSGAWRMAPPWWRRPAVVWGSTAAVIVAAAVGIGISMKSASSLRPSSRAVSAPSSRSTAALQPPAAAGQPININTATVDELDQLPGVGPVMAEKIVKAREERGGKFQSVDDLRTIAGIGEKKFERLKPYVTVK